MIFQWANCPFRIDVIVRLHKSSIKIITDKNSANIFSQQLNLSWRFDRLDNPVSGLPSCRFLWIISKNSIKQKNFVILPIYSDGPGCSASGCCIFVPGKRLGMSVYAFLLLIVIAN